MYSEMYGGGEWVKELRGKGMESAKKQEKRRQEARSLRDMGEIEKNYTAYHKKGQTGRSQQ